VVVFEPEEGRAYWFRYTILAPLPGVATTPAATLWAAFFDLGRPEPVAFKRILPLGAFDRGPRDRFSIGLGSARLGHGHCSGEGTVGSRRYAWDLRFTPAGAPERLEPPLLRLLPLPAHVTRPNAHVAFEGVVTVDGEQRPIARAPGLQFHTWGTRLPEDIRWMRCPRFAEDESARLEALSVRLARRLPGGLPAPWLSAISLHIGAGEIRSRGRASDGAGELAFHGETWRHGIRVRAWCHPRMLTGYVYRDPHGREHHVAQTDVGSCEVAIRSRLHPLARWGDTRRLTNRGSTAIEFHAPEPLPGVRYIAWDAERLRSLSRDGPE